MLLINRFRSGISGDVSLLTMSGALAQVLNLIAYPWLTRVYSPADFGIFAAVTSIATLFGALVCLRLDAIIQIASEEEETDILTTALIVSGTITCLTFALVFVGIAASERLGLGKSVLTAVPPALMATMVAGIALMNGLFALFRQYAAKQLRYRRVSVVQLLRTILAVAAQLVLVFLIPGPVGLIAGFAFGFLVSITLLWPIHARLIGSILAAPKIRWNRLQEVLKRHWEFISVDSVNVLISASILVLYPLGVLALFGGSEAGFFALASRIALIPVTILGASISTVYFQRFSLAARKRQGALRLYLQTLAMAVILALAIVTTLALLIEPLVSFAFDASWARTSLLVIYLLPTAFMRFYVSCIANTPLALKKPKVLFVWNLTQLAIIIGAASLSYREKLEDFLLYSGLGLLVASTCYVIFLYNLTRRIEFPQ